MSVYDKFKHFYMDSDFLSYNIVLTGKQLPTFCRTYCCHLHGKGNLYLQCSGSKFLQTQH